LTEVRTTKRASGQFAEARQSAAEAMRKRFDQVAEVAKQTRLDRYLETGRLAFQSGDYRAAMAAFEQALRIDPNDDYVRTRLADATKLAAGR
jgi:tetratricopeptide (TPR) repeat protein